MTRARPVIAIDGPAGVGKSTTSRELARRLGYVGKVAIHPAQVPIINDVFTPAPDVVAYQRKVLAAFEEE